jgi:hypothetical protein
VQARSLSPVGDASRSYFVAQHGHCIGSLLRGDVRSVLEASEAFLCEVERERRPTEIGVALRALGLTHCAMGSLKPVTIYLERALAEYDPERDREVRFSFGQDTKAAAAAWLSYIYWQSGRFVDARSLSESSIAWAVEVSHDPSLANTWTSKATLEVLHGNHRSPHATYVQVSGKGKCIPGTELRTAIQTSLSLRVSLSKFVQAFGVQTTHTAVCDAQSRLDVRLARWLLMAHDRIGNDTLPLTHEFLSLMLGVRRPGVTEALHALRKQGLISYGRGQITVKDREGMEHTADEAYGTPECPSSDDLRHIAGLPKGGSGSSMIEIMRHAVDAASEGLRLSGA